MKTIEKFAIGAGIILVLYFVMKDDKKDEKTQYEYKRSVKGADTFQPWERKKGSGSRS